MEEIKFERWDFCLSVIVWQTKNLLKHRFFSKELKKIIKTNPNLSEANPFIDWISESHYWDTTIRIGRLIDQHRDSISLYKLLEEIKGNPEILSRERFISTTGDLDIPKETANSLLDELIGKGKSHIDSLHVEWDIEELDEKSEKVKEVRDRAAAHIDKKEIKDWFCELEIDDCIDHIERLVKKYYTIFRGSSLKSFLPKIKDNWKDIFKFPWQSS